MKKVIIYSVVILSVLIPVSCTTDAISENDKPVMNLKIDDPGDHSTTPPRK